MEKEKKSLIQKTTGMNQNILVEKKDSLKIIHTMIPFM